MNQELVDRLLQFAVACAAEEDFPNHELRPIHLLKYLYLADLEYAKENNGETYTGADWEFLHFGPWCGAVQDRIEPALSRIGVQPRSFVTDNDYEAVSFGTRDRNLRQRLDPEIPVKVSRTILRNVRKFGSDTQGLLAYVYRTKPMLRAAPSEKLSFAEDVIETPGPQEPAPAPLSKKQEKRTRGKLRALRERMAEKRQARQVSQGRRVFVPGPNYPPEVIRALEEVAELEALPPESVGTTEFDPLIWKSASRIENDVP